MFFIVPKTNDYTGKLEKEINYKFMLLKQVAKWATIWERA